MPEEFSRTTANKIITLPSGQKVKIPVITKISFIDSADRHQEIQFAIDNSAQSNRIVHVDSVAGDGNDQVNRKLSVERIDTWNVLDIIDRGQESQISMDNVTGADSVPPHFSTHLRTHVIRYYQDPNNRDDNGVWIDSELIDEFVVVDLIERGQETHFTLNNPAADDPAGQANPADPDITDTNNGVDPPFRTDPFQNIIDFSSGLRPATAEGMFVIFSWHGPTFFTTIDGVNYIIGFAMSGPTVTYHALSIPLNSLHAGMEVHGTPTFSPTSKEWGAGIVRGAWVAPNTAGSFTNPPDTPTAQSFPIWIDVVGSGSQQDGEFIVDPTGVTMTWTDHGTGHTYPMPLRSWACGAEIGTQGSGGDVLYEFGEPDLSHPL